MHWWIALAVSLSLGLLVGFFHRKNAVLYSWAPFLVLISGTVSVFSIMMIILNLDD